MTRAPIIEVYADTAGEWRWRLRAANGELVANSGEGYTRQEDAVRAARTALELMEQATHRDDVEDE
jgi:uncharacterized protein YegP (UPF0339 family)